MPRLIAVLTLSLPLPPATDHTHGAQLSWRKRAIAELATQMPSERPAFGHHARVRALAGIMPGRALVEIIPAVAGVLVDAGLIAAIVVISDIETRWDKTIEPGRLRIEIAPAVPPLRRIGAAARQRIRDRTLARWARSRAPIEPQPV